MGAEPTQFGSTSCASLKDTWVMGGFIIEYRSTLCYVVSRRVTLNCSAVDDTYNELIILLIIASHRIASYRTTAPYCLLKFTSRHHNENDEETQPHAWRSYCTVVHNDVQFCTHSPPLSAGRCYVATILLTSAACCPHDTVTRAEQRAVQYTIFVTPGVVHVCKHTRIQDKATPDRTGDDQDQAGTSALPWYCYCWSQHAACCVMIL
jgi:hypothetical protein